jgi:hypothetical protein
VSQNYCGVMQSVDPDVDVITGSMGRKGKEEEAKNK